MSKKVLGKGLSALIGDLNVGELMTKSLDERVSETNSTGGAQSLTWSSEKKNVIKHVPLSSLVSGKYQPRTVFSEQELAELAASIAKNGIIQPILVRQIGINYEIVAGERRWRAAKIAELDSVPVIIKCLSDQEALEVALIENVQRQDLNVIDEAEGYRRLMNEFSYTQEALAISVGKSRSHIANLLRLLVLPHEVKEMLASGVLSLGHAKVLMTAENSGEIAQAVVSGALSVRETEKLLKAPAKPKLESRSFDFSHKKEKDRDLEAIEKSLTGSLGMKVRIEDRKDGGVVLVEFSNLEQLDTIIQVLSGNRAGL